MARHYNPKWRTYRGEKHWGDYAEFEQWKWQLDWKYELERRDRERERESSRRFTSYNRTSNQHNSYDISHTGQDEDGKEHHNHRWYDPHSNSQGSAGENVSREGRKVAGDWRSRLLDGIKTKLNPKTEDDN